MQRIYSSASTMRPCRDIRSIGHTNMADNFTFDQICQAHEGNAELVSMARGKRRRTGKESPAQDLYGLCCLAAQS
jgi:hypothetical protein